MKDINFDLQNLCKGNREGAFSTQTARYRCLQQVANQLTDLGYNRLRADGIKPKHVMALVSHWKGQNIASGTIKNRMSHIRWWADKVGKASVVERNDSLGIERRVYVDNEAEKARTLDYEKLARVVDPYVRVSLSLQEAFGLRREESIKFSSSYADKGDRVILKGSWTKGGKPREILIRTPEQRCVLDRAAKLMGGGALIRRDRNYVQQLRSYERETIRVGLDKNHGLRHTYAQQRFQELTGFKCPAVGGPTSKELSLAQKDVDRSARIEISRELGHEREQITAIYLGR